MLLGVTTLARTPLGLRTGIGAAVALAIAIEGAVLGVNIAHARETLTNIPEVSRIRARRFGIFIQGSLRCFRSRSPASFCSRRWSRRRARAARFAPPPSLAEFARERAFDPRPLVTNMPEPAAPTASKRIMITTKKADLVAEKAL